MPAPCRMLTLGLLVAALGCDSATFRADEASLVSQSIGPGHRQQIEAALTELFGTPDEPRLPPELPELASLVDLERLEQAAGPVESHEVGVTQGLYRRHCARCHGVSGDGRGPTALYQHPYPRDFRPGVFKFTSTPRGVPPTDDDLHATLKRGIPGTAMPSFSLLKEDERAAIIDYVKYLAIRGQLERELVSFAADEFDYNSLTGEEGPGVSLDSPDDREMIIEELLRPIVTRWSEARAQTIQPPPPHEGFPNEHVEQGRALFADQQRVGCIKCHGEVSTGGAGQGGFAIKDFDLWNGRRQAFLNQTNILADEIARLRANAAGNEFAQREIEMKRSELSRRRQLVAEMLPPVAAQPRSLGKQALRGGASPEDLFRHIQQGIDGAPMPAVAGVLTDEEVWSLVAFVLSVTQSEATP